MHIYLLSILFGIIEGLTEFLPISSTAHLRIAQAAAGVPLDDRYWAMYAVVIQIGAILSVVVYFWRRILKFLITFPRGAAGDRTIFNHPLTLTLAAFFITAAPLLVLKKMGVISKNLESLTVIGCSLVIGGIIMWIVDVLCRHPRTLEMEKLSLPQALWIGLAQIASAVFPGTSRSMSTIAAGQMAGMSRAAALEFSFFLSIPTMLAATAKDLLDTVQESGGGWHQFTSQQWLALVLGTVVSFIVAWGVIAWFMAWVRRHGFVPFAIYRLVLGAAVLIWAMK